MNSSSTLLNPKLPLSLGNLALDGFGNARRDSHPPKHPPDMSRRYVLLAGNLAEVRELPALASNGFNLRAKMGVHIDASSTGLNYSKRTYVVKEIIPIGVTPSDLSEIARAVIKTRKTLGYSQAALAQALGTIQGQVAKWEKDRLKPSGQMCAALARIAPDDEKEWWLAQAGVKPEVTRHEGVRSVPVLRDAAAAGTPRAVDDNEIDYLLSIPDRMVPRGGKLVGIKIEGDSMSPILETGYIALVDVTQRKPSSLHQRMVAARDGDGITVKWLRRQADDLYLLVPQKTSQRHQIQIMRPDGDWSIVGEVVMWIGQPPPTKRK